MSVVFRSALGVIIAAMTPALAYGDQLMRKDRFVALANDERLFIREVRGPGAAGTSAVLLIHGARVPGIASFDLPVPGGSLAADLAALGHIVYVLDLRGYGASSRPAAMDRPPGDAPPLMRTDDAVADIGAAIDAIATWSGDRRPSLLGWATGGHWAGAFASRHPEKVARVVLYNSLYGGSDQHRMLGRGTANEDPERPGHLNVKAIGAYRASTRESLFPAWDKSIPVDDKSTWRDPVVANAYAEAALESDPTSTTRTPPSFRAPSGALADSFELALDRRQWSAARLTMPVLVIRSENDFWSRPADADAIVAEAPNARLVTIPRGTHFTHLERPEAGRRQFLAALEAFLGSAD
jgi:pimeloyl-ACP methyl ester carboxylesterase